MKFLTLEILAHFYVLENRFTKGQTAKNVKLATCTNQLQQHSKHNWCVPANCPQCQKDHSHGPEHADKAKHKQKQQETELVFSLILSRRKL